MIAALLLAALQGDAPEVRLDRTQVAPSSRGGYDLTLTGEAPEFPDNARLHLSVTRSTLRIDWAREALTLVEEPIPLSGRDWTAVRGRQWSHTVTVPSFGFYTVVVQFHPTRQKDPGVEAAMRRDYRPYSFDFGVDAAPLERIPDRLRRSWKALADQAARWDALFAEMEPLVEDRDGMKRWVTRRQEHIGAETAAIQSARGESLLTASTDALALLARDFNNSLTGWLEPPSEGSTGLYVRPWYLLADAALTPSSARGWLARLPEFAVREHALLELGLMNARVEFLAEADTDAIPETRLRRELQEIDKERAALDEIHRQMLDSEHAERFLAVTVFEDKKKKLRVTLEELLPRYGGLVEAAAPSIVDDPAGRVEAFRASLEAFAADAALLRDALLTPPADEEAPKEP